MGRAQVSPKLHHLLLTRKGHASSDSKNTILYYVICIWVMLPVAILNSILSIMSYTLNLEVLKLNGSTLGWLLVDEFY